MDEPPYERIFFTGRRRLRDASLMLTGRAGDAYGTSLLTGGGGLRDGGARTSLLTGRRRRRLRASLRDGALITGGAYGTSFYGTTLLTRDGGGGACGTSLLVHKRLRDEPYYGPAEAEAYGTEALTGRASLRDGLLTGRRRLRDEPPYGRRRLRDEPPYGTSLLARRQTSLRTEALLYGPEALTGRLLTGGSAYGTSANTGRRRLRDGRASLRDEPPCTEALTDEPPYERRRFFTCRRRLRDASLRAEALTGRALIRRARDAYGTSLLTGRRRRLAGRASLRDAGAGTSLLTGRRRRRLRDEPPYGTAR